MERGYAQTKQEKAMLEAAGVPVVYDKLADAIPSLRAGDVFVIASNIDFWSQRRIIDAGCEIIIIEATR